MTFFKNLSLVKLLWLALAVGALVAAAFFAVSFYYASRTIFDLFRENRKLKESLANLTAESQIGYAKVLEQATRDGQLYTRLRFAETDREDTGRVIFEQEFEVPGDVVHFDALIVTFSPERVMDGRERALYLWRRVYGETMPPETGFTIGSPGDEPRRYAGLLDRLSLRQRKLFWREIWQLADEPERLKKLGIRAVYGNAVYKKVRPGVIYVFRIDNAGHFFPESVPDL